MQLKTDKPFGANKIFNKIAFSIIAAACSLVLVGALSGCSNQPTSLNAEDQTLTPSEYMVKLNQAAESLHENLDAFAAAVSTGDLTTLQSKSDSAFQAMDDLKELKTPDELSQIRAKYEEAVDALHSSLNDYIAVYIEIENEPDLARVDMAKYAERFTNIQMAYDNGINLLEQADTAAKNL